jgi:DNA-binding beta-propeller fold protein YncE
MNFRQLTLIFAIALAATFTLRAQTAGNGQGGYWPTTAQTHEKLYVNSGEGDTNNLTIIDVKTMKIIKKMTTGKHPHGVASPKTQDVLYIASETEGTVTKLDTIKDEIIEVYGGWGTEPQESDITPDGRFLYQPSYAGYWNVFDTQKKEVVSYIHTLGIGHNTLIDPQGHFAYLFPIKGGPGHWRRPSLGLPRTQPNEVTVVDITKNHQVVGTIPVGDGPRPPIMSADGKRIYMDVDRFMGFLVIDTEARKVISKATMNLTADEQAQVPNGHAHGIAIGNGGKEVWTNATGLDTTFVFDVTVTPPKQIARIPVGAGPYWIVPSQDGMTMFVACPASDEMMVLDVATKKMKTSFKFPAGDHPVRMIDLAVPVRTQVTSR